MLRQWPPIAAVGCICAGMAIESHPRDSGIGRHYGCRDQCVGGPTWGHTCTTCAARGPPASGGNYGGLLTTKQLIANWARLFAGNQDAAPCCARVATPPPDAGVRTRPLTRRGNSWERDKTSHSASVTLATIIRRFDVVSWTAARFFDICQGNHFARFARFYPLTIHSFPTPSLQIFLVKFRI